VCRSMRAEGRERKREKRAVEERRALRRVVESVKETFDRVFALNKYFTKFLKANSGSSCAARFPAPARCISNPLKRELKGRESGRVPRMRTGKRFKVAV